jgi:hypothetical protein
MYALLLAAAVLGIAAFVACLAPAPPELRVSIPLKPSGNAEIDRKNTKVTKTEILNRRKGR